jgi:LPS-assembly lipoprotein
MLTRRLVGSLTTGRRGMRACAVYGLVLALLLATLSGCGFRLRGQAHLPPEMAVTYIQTGGSPTDPPSELKLALQCALEANGVVVTPDPQQAQARLIILNEQSRRRTLAAGPRGEAREYTLTYTVDYTATKADGTPLIPQETATLSRDLLYSEADVLGRDAGEAIILRDLRADITRSILLRLQLAARP